MQYLKIHPRNPQPRLISQAVASVRNGGVIVYPTDSCYALGCHIGNKTALDRIRQLRRLDTDHEFTLVCRDLSDLATYAKFGNREFRLLKTLTPGPYTVILNATREVPRRLQHPKRKTIGLRVPDHPVVQALLDALGEPLMSVSLIMPDDDLALSDPEEIRDRLGNRVDVIVDSGNTGCEPTSVIDMTGDVPRIVRQGKGDTSFISAA
jgi:tRNA threonylcarbamoyl adenosine modification protein (Sua5/YciO/YrdC/YwlC family)